MVYEEEVEWLPLFFYPLAARPGSAKNLPRFEDKNSSKAFKHFRMYCKRAFFVIR